MTVPGERLRQVAELAGWDYRDYWTIWCSDAGVRMVDGDVLTAAGLVALIEELLRGGWRPFYRAGYTEGQLSVCEFFDWTNLVNYVGAPTLPDATIAAYIAFKGASHDRTG